MSFRYKKKIETTFLELDNRKRKEVTIYGVKEFHGGPINGFGIEFPDGSTVEHTDLKQLIREAAKVASSKFSEVSREILIVDVGGNSDYDVGDDQSEYLSVGYCRVTEHVMQDGDTYYTKKVRRVYKEPREDDGVIEWSEEREGAIKSVIAGMITLRTKLGEMLHDNHECAKSLDGMTAAKLLPSSD